ncbi:hypothetical protein [Aeoliella mucimassa]|uniref:Uncharacterized protein n=1 Tax=Aeoliella mucimassa TaxID=2527972 RepID=A0A518AGI5_9BACT|nr:hypothetical protein [Aeoliella mucimassa]QDU53836.1 hypothetical protein Pan181_00140 [Aeoliella mucimassa]
MSSNPFESPQEQQVTGLLSGDRDDLRKVAQYQKGILVCILLYFCAVFAQFAVPAEVVLIVGLVAFAAAIAGAVFTFLLAVKTYGTVLGIILGFLCLVPLLGLLILLIVNGKATTILRNNNIKVGLLGADPSSI